ncbi:MAG: ABC transporter substrate-binding protein [Deltaproteobacteria bacterium]|nr:MAG: ABC transporter substrate-binding protein [Deltaproteobacteria bacterium]
MRKKLLLLMTAVLVVGLALTVFPGSASAKTFKWAFQGDANSLDPHSLNETFLIGFLGNVYEGLVRRGPDLKTEPCLAERWKMVEPTRWRFYLRKGVKFHNGNDFNADDVIFTVARTRSEGSDFKTRVSTIKEVVKIDDYTVDFITTQPNPILISEWSTWYMMDKEWCEKNDAVESTNIKSGKENYATRHENGTGPFVITERQTDVKTVMKPFDGWWDTPKHNLTEVIFTPISSDATRVAALLSGEIDMMYPVPVQDIKRVNDHPGTSVLSGPELRTIFLGFNQADDELKCSNIKGKNPLKDKRVRQAFYQAINIDAIKKKIMRGLSEPSAIMISPKLFQPFGKDFKRLPYDPAAAKKLLAEAGYPDGFNLCMDCPNNRYVNDEQICQAVVSMLAKVGVKVNLKAQPKAQYFKKVLAYDTEFYLLGWTPSSFDSYNVLYNLIDSRDKESGRGKFNLGGYANVRIDELTDQILSETDLNKRNQMIKEAYELLNNDIGYIPLHQQALAWGKKDNINLVQRADNQFMLYYVTVK